MPTSVNSVNSSMYEPGTSSTNGVIKGNANTDTSAKTGSTASLGKDDFLKLLLAQMRNQDPLNPTDNTEFVAQLAQFSSLEQMTQMNANLDKLIENNNTTTDSINRAMMVNYFGKSINAEVPDFVFDGKNPADLNFITESAFNTGKLEILDSDGDVVRTIDLKAMEAGNHTVTWNGVNKSGKTAEAGDYSYKLTLTDLYGEEVAYTPVFAGVVDGITYQDGKSYIYSGGVLIPYDKIRNVLSGS